ncbi:glycosyltransferase [Marivita sp. XM-24bin2]|uniref:glycosyltransferase n=1 Tax=Marivita sp. XM-24bin2 TaxID=2133951 RepID=UPI000D791273|nr:glycosyltransferase [Marivita sp. XM-24bin2]MCR9108703.1 glycosyltransferase [Paracoccaceae bacterium]PWL34177.1 MAG: hypothetical protein DCO97_15810 [Marivita sp. XM-24bin2]
MSCILVTSNFLVSHFMPLLPITQALKKTGHDVRVAAVSELGPEISKRGLDHLVMTQCSEQAFDDLKHRVQMVPREDTGKFFMSHFFMDLAPRSAIPGLLEELELWRPDLILRESTEFAGLIAAKRLNIRHVRFEIVNGESEESIASNYTAEIDALLSSVSLPASKDGYIRDELAFSAHPGVLDDTVRINTRPPYRFRNSAAARTPVTDRPDWLPDQDTPLIYMTFGTVTANEGRSRQIFDASVKAVADLPITVLVTTGKDAPPDLIENVPDNVVVRDFVDQAEVLAFAEVMVCHGGSGTVLGGLEAGVPMIIVPMFADQPDNARCLEAVGLSTTIHEHEVEVLGAKILDILGDPKRKRAAKEAADNFAKLPTLADAVRELVAD